jgi:hypothetical protein
VNDPKWLFGLKSDWITFRYNFRWSSYVWLLDGPMSKLAIAIPLVGYLILFNDTIASSLRFNDLANENMVPLIFSYLTRLKLLYVGLVLIGIASIQYRLFRPSVSRFAVDKYDYVERGLESFVFADFAQIHAAIREHKRGHLTPHGDYPSSEWDGFQATALGKRQEWNVDYEEGVSNWAEAKSKYENLLRAMLLETHFKADTSRRKRLASCLSMSICGHLLLALPSIDLFLRVASLIVTQILEYSV